MNRLFFALMLVTTSAFSQNKTSRNDFKYRFGFKMAPNVSWIKSDDKSVRPNGSSLNFSYGITFDKKLNQTFLFTTGFDITNINTNLVINKSLYFAYPNSSNLSDTVRLSQKTDYKNYLRYLEIPLLFSGRTKEIGYMTYFFQAGITPSVLLKQRADISSSNDSIRFDNPVLLNSGSRDEFTSKKDDIASIRVGFVLGAGVEYNLQGTTSLVGSIRYNNGLFNIMRDPNRDFQAVKSHYISLNIGIVF